MRQRQRQKTIDSEQIDTERARQKGRQKTTDSETERYGESERDI